MTSSITGRPLHPGAIRGRALVLDEPLSFWGGFDPVTGAVIDRAHPQEGTSLSDMVVVMPGSRGSAGTPGVVAESIRRGTAPKAFVVTKADINLTAGAVIAAALYAIVCPIVLIDEEAFDRFADGVDVDIDDVGSVIVSMP